MGKIILAFVAFVVSFSVSAEIIKDPRYCGEPKRNASGKIYRSIVERDRFESLYPLPAQYTRQDWQVDHVIPLAVGGCDAIINMQWLPKKIKTCADDNCKDRFERIIYLRK